MFPHETAWVDLSESLQWPASTSDISSPFSHHGAQENGRHSHNTSYNGSAPITHSHPMYPPPVCPRPYRNIQSLPFSPSTPAHEFGGITSGMVSQGCLSPGYVLPGSFSVDRHLGRGLDEDNLLDGLSVFPGHDADSSLEALPSEDAIPNVTTLRKAATLPASLLTLDTRCSYPPLSSPFSCTTGSLDLSDRSAYSDTPSYGSDYTPNSSLSFSYTPISPVPSPCFPRAEMLHGGCPSRTTQTLRSKVRAAPYTLDGSRKRASTWSSMPRSCAPEPEISHLPSPSTNFSQMSPSTMWMSSQPGTSVPTTQNPQALQQALLPSRFDNNCPPVNQPPRQGKLPISPNGNGIRYLEHYFDFPGPPDLVGHLKEEPSSPPPEDMDSEDPSMIPREQEVRFQNDLYTPRWVRGQGNKREGWCGICKPGRWLVLKNSAFWYDKCFSHGISSATGQAFMAPQEMRRAEGNAHAWEGLCRICGKWVSLVSSKKKRTTWFRHAYKCHQSTKSTNALKKSREIGLAGTCSANGVADFEALPTNSMMAKSKSKALGTPAVGGFNFNYLDGGPPLVPQTPLEAIASMF